MAENIAISFEIDGQEAEAFRRVLMNRWGRANNLRQPLQRAADFMTNQIDINFSRSGAVWDKWKRRKHVYPHPILRKTNTMRKGFVARVGSHEATISNPVNYFKFHQLGTGKMVARKMWGINDEQAREITKRIQEYLVEESKI